MTYLIHMGLDSEESFKIMESTRKGIIAKGKEPRWEEYKKDMRDHGVPEWYIGSCEKIKYMFPKAHAAAYVMMAWRIATVRSFIHWLTMRPFSVSAPAPFPMRSCVREEINWNIIWQIIKNVPILFLKRSRIPCVTCVLSRKCTQGALILCQLIFIRQKQDNFQIIDGKLMPSLSSIDGLGEKAAEAVVDAVKDGPFLSVEDFSSRTKVNGTICSLMSDLGLLKDLPQSNQLNLFELM